MDFANFAAGEDEFDEIVPMQLDTTNSVNASVVAAPFHYAGEQRPQQQQSLFPSAFANSHACSPSSFGQQQHQSMSSNYASGVDLQQQQHFNNNNNPLGATFGQAKSQQWTAQWHQQQYSHYSQHHQHQSNGWQHHQPPPLRKESMPALHFNDQPLQSPPHSSGYFQHPNSHFAGSGGHGHPQLNHNGSHPYRVQPHHLEHPLERTRSLSTAVFFCSPSSSSLGLPHPQQQSASAQHSPNSGCSLGGGLRAELEQQRRTKSTALPSPSHWPSSVHSGPHLRRFNSQLRSPRRYSPSTTGAVLPIGQMMGVLPPLKPYTPPPILSPMRSGSGLFHRIAGRSAERKPSSLALSHHNATNLFEEAPELEAKSRTSNAEAGKGDENEGEEEEEEEEMTTEEAEREGDNGQQKGATQQEHEETGERPQRKNGFLFSGDGSSGSGLFFAAELEQLRKQSCASGRQSHKNSMVRMSIRNKLSTANEDFIRKMSSVSMDEEGVPNCKGKDGDGDAEAPESDAIPHINLGKNYQARVKKWADRAISAQERAAIPDRDEPVFECRAIEHIAQEALAAYETLACSVAVPKPGRNKELALHILAENQGNLQAAVMDLLRCDTLDWEQYPSIYNNLYVDVEDWSPEEISSFQDAIYKSEKDFQQVAAELGNRSVRECVAFYYTWKKTCPDDYRKLRNLRRKRQLLEQQLDFSSFASRQHLQSEHAREEPSSDEEFSGTESDITNPSLAAPLSMDCSPQRKVSMPHPNADAAVCAPSALLPPTAGQLFNNGATGLAASAYPWLHGDIFPSPSSSSTSTNNNDTAHFGQNGMGGGENNGHHHHHGALLDVENGHYGHKIRSAAIKKGAQPSADGFFHCRLCEKRFEKVKSLNAHMKSHAMKARAEAEAQIQQQHKQQQQHQLAFPVPAKKDPEMNPLGTLAGQALAGGPLNLSSQAAMAAAALNNLNRQFQQQQQGGAQTTPFGMGGNLLLRNMLGQYAQGQAGATVQANAVAQAAQWPAQTHFNA